jgi:hypothetical protein
MRQERITRKRRTRRTVQRAEPRPLPRLAGGPAEGECDAADDLLRRIEMVLRPAERFAD